MASDSPCMGASHDTHPTHAVIYQSGAGRGEDLSVRGDVVLSVVSHQLLYGGESPHGTVQTKPEPTRPHSS